MVNDNGTLATYRLVDTKAGTGEAKDVKLYQNQRDYGYNIHLIKMIGRYLMSK